MIDVIIICKYWKKLQVLPIVQGVLSPFWLWNEGLKAAGVTKGLSSILKYKKIMKISWSTLWLNPQRLSFQDPDQAHKYSRSIYIKRANNVLNKLLCKVHSYWLQVTNPPKVYETDEQQLFMVFNVTCVIALLILFWGFWGVS